jgi:hypothetical protein
MIEVKLEKNGAHVGAVVRLYVVTTASTVFLRRIRGSYQSCRGGQGKI